MQKIINPSQSDWPALMQRPQAGQPELWQLAADIFRAVSLQGDRAVKKYSARYDGVARLPSKVTAAQFNQAIVNLPDPLKQAIHLAAANIEAFHETQQAKEAVTEPMTGIRCWRENRPIDTVGLYIPGGSAPLFSTVLMLGIPAKLAGCREIVLCTPPDRRGNIHPAILYTAYLAGITTVYGIGGMQAIAAMAVGTETVPKTDKIFGPGNQYVTAAKQYAQWQGTAIDLPAGPSEVLIIADASCNPAYVAADLLSQAEHGPDSQVILLTDRETVANEVIQQLYRQLEALPRKEIALAALQHSKAIVFPALEKCLAFSNRYAPEHLILAMDDPGSYTAGITCAGSVFLGHYSCESAGDYASGTNHTLPTGGHARGYSGVSLESFIKKISFQELTAEGLGLIGPAIALMAEAEQLQAHKNAVTLRLKTTDHAPLTTTCP